MSTLNRGPGRRLLREMFRRRRGALVAGLACGLAGQLAYLATPALVQRAVDGGLDAGEPARAAGWAAAVVAMALIVLVGGLLGERLTRHAANATAQDLRDRLLERAGAADGAVAARFDRGDLASRAERDVAAVADWVDKLTYWTLAISTILVVVPAIATLHPRLLVVTAVMAPLVVLTQLIFPRRYAAAAERVAGAHAQRAGAVEELLSALGAVRGLGGAGRLVRRHADASAEVSRHTLAMARIAAWWAAVPPSVPRLAIAAGLAAGGLAVLDGDLSVGGLVAYASWMTMLTIALSFLVLLVSNRRDAEVSGTRIAQVLDVPRPVREGPHPTGGHRQPPAANGDRLAPAAGGDGLARSAGGDGLARSAGGDGLARSAGGDGLARSAGGDGLVPSAGGDGLARSAGGDGLARSAGGDGLARSAGGDGLARSAGGDGLARSAGGDGLARSAGGDGLAPAAGGDGVAQVSDVPRPVREGPHPTGGHRQPPATDGDRHAAAARGPAVSTVLPERGELWLLDLSARTGAGGAPTPPLRLTAAPGELVVLQGPVGSGKSSLLRVVAGLDEPVAGAVCFGGVDITLAGREAWWALIGYVPQRPLVLTGTIADNVRLGRESGDDEVAWACRVAGADGFVRALAGGYGTAVGERGTTLSGGQVQRLALARAVLGRPRVLLLDDVTSAIDVVTERAILDRLRTDLPETAIVAVSHRTQIRARADRVVELLEPVSAGRVHG